MLLYKHFYVQPWGGKVQTKSVFLPVDLLFTPNLKKNYYNKQQQFVFINYQDLKFYIYLQLFLYIEAAHRSLEGL